MSNTIVDSIESGKEKVSQSISSGKKKLSQSLLFRSLLIFILAMMMQIPLSMVSDVVYERSRLYNSVLNEISNIWGQPQTMTGALLVIPYTEKYIYSETITDANNRKKKVQKERIVSKIAVFLPNYLEIKPNIKHEYRHRAIYQSLVYNTTLTLFRHKCNIHGYEKGVSPYLNLFSLVRDQKKLWSNKLG